MPVSAYSPAGLVRVTSWLVPSRFFARTWQLGTTAPLGSWTTPVSVPAGVLGVEVEDGERREQRQIAAAADGEGGGAGERRAVGIAMRTARTRDSRPDASAMAGASDQRCREEATARTTSSRCVAYSCGWHAAPQHRVVTGAFALGALAREGQPGERMAPV